MNIILKPKFKLTSEVQKKKPKLYYYFDASKPSMKHLTLQINYLKNNSMALNSIVLDCFYRYTMVLTEMLKLLAYGILTDDCKRLHEDSPIENIL